jgi:hypothetical protein
MMNKRIEELAEQAGIAVWGDAVYMYDSDDTLDSTVMEKFAELIVKECAGLVDHVIMEDGTRRSDFIRKHFGVEE